MQTPLVFLQGMAQPIESWNAVIAALPEHTVTRAVDVHAPLRDGAAPSIEGLTVGLGQSLENLEIEGPIDLCGLSLGAMVALKYAADNPGRVRRLVLAAGQYRLHQRFLLGLQAIMFRAIPEKQFSNTGLTKAQFLALNKCFLGLDLTRALEAVSAQKIPTLVLCGSHDYANLRASREMAAAIEGAELKILKAGHEMNAQIPGDLAAELTRFLNL